MAEEKPKFLTCYLRWRDNTNRFYSVGVIELELENFKIHKIPEGIYTMDFSELADGPYDSARLYADSGDDSLLHCGSLVCRAGEYYFVTKKNGK